jgi:general L-amino acid transport system substrate-binding protein
MRFFSILLALIVICCSISDAAADRVVDRAKARGVLRCGSVERPGLASPDGHGRWKGLEVDVCRAVAAAVLGSPERIEYHVYETPKDFDAVRNQQDDICFLTGSEIDKQKLAGKVLPGPTVFVESHGVMVPVNSAAHHVRDLAGHSICFMIGSPVERSLGAYFDAIHLAWFRRAFSEDGEMVDTYAVQNCHAIAGEITTLASNRFARGVNRLSSRILPETLANFPVMAVTGVGDAQWSAIVAWTIHTLVSVERPETRWYAGGAEAMPITAPEIGLDSGWQRRVLTAIGNYRDIFERNLGKSSALKLDHGLNTNHILGGMLMSPFLEWQPLICSCFWRAIFETSAFHDEKMIEMEAVEMKICKPIAVIRKSQSLPPHIPREMPLIYQVLDDIEEGVRLMKKAVYRRLRKEALE